MKLIIVRHGETVANTKKILQGKNDGKLTEKGKLQAKEVGKHLKDHHKIDMVFCSPLGRCVDTLNYILEEYPIEGEVLMSKLIEERDFGEYTGTEYHMVNWEEVDKGGKINEEMGVESMESMRKRVELFLEDLKLENPEANILIVAHSGPIRIMISKLTGKTYEESDVGNGLISEFDYETELKF